jgi:hypothetical protein
MAIHFNGYQSKIDTFIKQKLSRKEIATIDMRLLGNIVYCKTMELSRKVNTDLLEVISHWFNDPGWMTRFKINKKNKPDWAKHKRKQRQWEKQQKRLAAERLGLYLEEIRKRKEFRNKMKKLFGKSSSSITPQIEITEDFIVPIISPFSPPEQHKEETKQQFLRAFNRSISDLLPWKLLISNELNETTKFNNLKTYYSEKRMDTASKIIHLLQMESVGEIKLIQGKSFGNIYIEPIETQSETEIIITDRHGKDYHFEWQALSENQRNKIVKDIANYEILYKRV